MFGWQQERRAERAFAARYEGDLQAVLPRLRADRMAAAVALAELPMAVRGFGPVKAAAMVDAGAQRDVLLARLEGAVVVGVAA